MDDELPQMGGGKAVREASKRRGIRRLPFLGCLVALGVMAVLFPPNDRGELVFMWGAQAYFIMLRLDNIGHPRWWTLMALVPGLNVVLGIRCFIMPEGFASHGQLDKSARVAAAVVGIALVVTVALAFMYV